MKIDEVKIYLDNEINRLSLIGINKLYANDIDICEENIADILTKYYNSKQISIEVKKCIVQNNWDLMLWW